MYSCLLLLTVFTVGKAIEQNWSPYVSQSIDMPYAKKSDSIGEESSLWNACSDSDNKQENGSVMCQGVRMLSKAVKQLLESPSVLHLAEGVDVVKVSGEDHADTSRNLVENDNGIVGRFGHFISNHELRVKLRNILPSPEDISKMFSGEETQEETGRKKGGGAGGLIGLALMMKGMMGAMGLGGVALLAMKAMMVSAMAFMLSAIVGIKKLASKDDDGGTHHIQVVPSYHHGDYGHHKRKRDVEESIKRHPYRAYRHV